MWLSLFEEASQGGLYLWQCNHLPCIYYMFSLTLYLLDVLTYPVFSRCSSTSGLTPAQYSMLFFYWFLRYSLFDGFCRQPFENPSSSHSVLLVLCGLGFVISKISLGIVAFVHSRWTLSLGAMTHPSFLLKFSPHCWGFPLLHPFPSSLVADFHYLICFHLLLFSKCASSHFTFSSRSSWYFHFNVVLSWGGSLLVWNSFNILIDFSSPPVE